MHSGYEERSEHCVVLVDLPRNEVVVAGDDGWYKTHWSEHGFRPWRSVGQLGEI